MNPLREIASSLSSLAKGLGVTISYLFRKKVTLMYPEERPVLTERFRGVPALPLDPATGRDRCIACGACARVCPQKVIVVVAEVGEDKKRRPGEFSLDVAGCIFCGLCVEVCPTHALVMSDEFELACSSRADLLLGLEKLHEIGGEFPPKPEETDDAGESSAETSAPAETIAPGAREEEAE